MGFDQTGIPMILSVEPRTLPIKVAPMVVGKLFLNKQPWFQVWSSKEIVFLQEKSLTDQDFTFYVLCVDVVWGAKLEEGQFE